MRKLPSSSAVGTIFPAVSCRGGAEVSPEDVWAELERIFASPHFQASERRRAFLRFIVGEALAGRANSLKGYTIAVAVFARDESFDPQADPVVRLEARRLRRDLDSYYVDAGQNDAIRISIPRGSYVPNFDWHNAPPHPSTAIGHHFADVADSTHRREEEPFPREPAVLVMPFEALSPGENTRYLAIGISQELIGNLFRFTGFRLYSLPIGPDLGSDLGTARGSLGFAYVVNGSVQTSAEEIRVTTQVLDATSGKIVWTKTYTRPCNTQSLMSVQRELADEIATVIGQPYGVVANDIGKGPSPALASSMESYMCVLRAYAYRRNFSRTDFEPMLRCLQQAVRRDPEYSDAWAMLGWAHVDAGRLGYSGENNRQKEYEKALEATSRALALQPNNTLALKVLGAVYHYLGHYTESERITRQAVDLNPNDPEALAQLGWRLAVRGNFEEGIPALKRAIDRSLNPPSWYFHLIAIELYMKGDYEQMLAVAKRAALGGLGFSQFLIAIANGAIGQSASAQRALERMLQYEPVARDPEGYLHRHGATEQIADALMAGFRKAQSIASEC